MFADSFFFVVPGAYRKVIDESGPHIHVDDKEISMKDPTYSYTISSFMDARGIIFSYKGPITQEILIAVGDNIKEKISETDVQNVMIKRVFAVFVEQAQNILKYSYERLFDSARQKGVGIGLVGVGRESEERFFVFAGNLIPRQAEETLRSRLEHINSLDREQLKQYYNQQRKNGSINEDGGAGLGFIDMARRSGHPIEFHFLPIDEQASFFEIKITISTESK
jgi:hypothetical protein